MDIEILDTLEYLAKERSDLCTEEDGVYTLKFPDGEGALRVNTNIEERSHDLDMAQMLGWSLTILRSGLAPHDASIRVDYDFDDGMLIYNVSASLGGYGHIGESEIFEYAVFDCLRQCVEKDAFPEWAVYPLRGR